MKYLYFGHHKCGSTWIRNVLSYITRLYGLNHEYYESHHTFDKDLNHQLIKNQVDFASIINAVKEDINMDDFKGFHVIRDPRDVLISAFFSHLNSHGDDHWPELRAHRQKIQGMDKSEALIHDMEFTSELPINGHPIRPIEAMKNWDYQNDSILELKYEDIIQNPYQLFGTIFKFLKLTDEFGTGIKSLFNVALDIFKSKYIRKADLNKLTIPIWVILLAQYHNDFYKLSGGRKPGTEDSHHHMRKGIQGDWANHFDKQHKDWFKERYPDLLIQLGYEKNNDW